MLIHFFVVDGLVTAMHCFSMDDITIMVHFLLVGD